MEFAMMMTPSAPGAAPAPTVAARVGIDGAAGTAFDQVLASQVAGPAQEVAQQAPTTPATEAPAQSGGSGVEEDASAQTAETDPAVTAPPVDVTANSAAAAALAAWMLTPVVPATPAPTLASQSPEVGTDPDALATAPLSDPGPTPSASTALVLALPDLQPTDPVPVVTALDAEAAPETRTAVAPAPTVQSPAALFQALLPQVAAPPPPAQSAPALPLPDLPQLSLPVGSHGWAEELVTRLALQSVRGEYSGSLRLSPEHLGPLEVQIRLQDDKASVVFGAQHADTRTALHEALPRLRELFASSGLQLLDASVTRDGSRQPPLPARMARGLGVAAVADATPETRPLAMGLRHRGLVDTIA